MARAWKDLLDRFPASVVDTAAGRVGVRCTGNGSELVLLHGIGSGSGSWVFQLASMAARHRVIAWDAPGYGDSDDPSVDRPDAGTYAAALAALFDALSVKQCVLVGHSLGAIIATRFAADRPERVSMLILADPAAGHARLDEAERERRLTERLERFDRLGNRRHAEERAAALLSPAAPADRLALVLWNMARLRRSGYAKAARLLADGDLISDAARVAAPGAVVYGGADTITPPDACHRVAAAFDPPYPFREIPGAGHACYVEAPERFDTLLTEYAGVVA